MILIASPRFFFCFCFCFCFFFIPFLSSGADTLVVNQSLSGGETLLSLAGNFEMGFFRPGESPTYYIGIWYKKVKPTTIVWVANRETPISDKFSSHLKIIDGNLVLLDESNTQIWSTNLTVSTATDTSSASVVLHDDGNLVLRYGSSSSLPIWQTFNHPSHVLLPGSNVRYDKWTNTKQIITSWRSSEDPAVGPFSLEIDENALQYVLKWNKTVQYWASGPWNGRSFSLVPEMTLNIVYNFTYVSNGNDSYFTYSLYNPSVIVRFILDVSGQIQQQTWLESEKQWNLFLTQPRKQCEIYGVCGAFGTCNQNTLPFCKCLAAFEPRSPTDWNLSDSSGGCVRKTKLNCTVKKENLGFITSYVPVKSFSQFLENGTLLSDESACRRSCLDECSCDAYSFRFKICRLWNSVNLNNISLVFVSDDANRNSVPINIKVSSSDLPSNPAKINTTVLLVAGIISGFSGLVILCSIAVIFYRSVKRREKKRSLVGKTTMEGLLVAFVYRDLQIATKNFSDKLGGGGFGSVFKGVLRDSSVVAVKKLDSISQGEKQFRSEVSTIGTTKHIHLVRLRGFCAQGNSKLLVYDYMPNGSLDSHLFHDHKPILNWKTRYEIALGIARGLVYLHEKCRDCIIHCDIKPENILLDADFCPKIADFGLAKLVGRDFSRVLTTFRGTRGYLAPEWLSGVAVTAKADVFSYGMLLFELVKGKRNAERSEDSSRCTFFPYLAAGIVMVGGDILSLLDSKLNREANIEEVIKICKVAFWCIQDEEESRPSMSVVEQILEGVLDVNMPPVPRSIRLSVYNTEPIVFFTELSSQGSTQAYSNP